MTMTKGQQTEDIKDVMQESRERGSECTRIDQHIQKDRLTLSL